MLDAPSPDPAVADAICRAWVSHVFIRTQKLLPSVRSACSRVNNFDTESASPVQSDQIQTLLSGHPKLNFST